MIINTLFQDGSTGNINFKTLPKHLGSTGNINFKTLPKHLGSTGNINFKTLPEHLSSPPVLVPFVSLVL